MIAERLQFHSNVCCLVEEFSETSVYFQYYQIPGNLTVEWRVLRSTHRKPDASLVACSVVLDQMDCLLWLQREGRIKG